MSNAEPPLWSKPVVTTVNGIEIKSVLGVRGEFWTVGSNSMVFVLEQNSKQER